MKIFNIYLDVKGLRFVQSKNTLCPIGEEYPNILEMYLELENAICVISNIQYSLKDCIFHPIFN